LTLVFIKIGTGGYNETWKLDYLADSVLDLLVPIAVFSSEKRADSALRAIFQLSARNFNF
jgi:hypothetical protein